MQRPSVGLLRLSGDEEQGLLAAVEVADRRAVEHGVLLQHEPDGLAAPLGHRHGRVELDRVGRVREQRVVAAAGDAALLVPQPDRRAGAVPVEPDGGACRS